MYTNPNHRHGATGPASAGMQPMGVLITNLGTPEAPTTAAVRRYLAEFLSDPRVVDSPRWLWLPVLYGVILRVRPRRSAAAYREVWSEKGSPLLVNSRQQAAALQAALDELLHGAVKVELGMRYGKPSIAAAMKSLQDWGARRVLVLPLYPQYAASTTGSTYDAIFEALTGTRHVPDLRLVSDYHDHPGYIDALAESVRAVRMDDARLLMSFHGLPKRYCEAGDPYYDQCMHTARLLAARLGEAPENWDVAFQSRVGREEWLQPYTETTLRKWAADGVRRVQVLCPGFSADCLETLEEIAISGDKLFRSCGGEALQYIPALNDHPQHIAALADIVLEHTMDWQKGEAARGD